MRNIDLKSFESKRLALLTRLESGKIDKPAFLLESMELFDGVMYSEPDKISSVEEGVFYYYYYNTYAKYYMIKNRGELGSLSATISNEYYEIKESVLIKTLELLDDSELDAYYVDTNSLKLKNRLVEIVVPSSEKLIFHTMKPKTIAWLKRKNLLTSEIRKSKINSYVNAKYY